MADSDHKIISPFDNLVPGDTLIEYLDAQGWNQSDLARRSGITPKTISEICNGKAPITPITALHFEKVFSRPAHFWLNLQRQYDESLARRKFKKRTKEWIDWSKKFPIKELIDLELLPNSKEPTGNIESLLNFFGVSSPEGWDKVWKSSHVAYRQTRKISTSIESISAWVRATEYYSGLIQVSEFDTEKVVESISSLRKCTTYRAEHGIEKAINICASAGIALVFVPSFKNTGISGCARWLSSDKAMIALSNRYKTDDTLWFTFFHELAHLLLHRKTHVFVLDNAVEDVSDKVVDPTIQKQEDEANRFAADTLIPPEQFLEFVNNSMFTNESIKSFSKRIGIGPGIVVGRLQHEQIIKPFQGNKLKQTINFNVH